MDDMKPPHLYLLDRPKFEEWCESQKHVILYPKADGCVVFINHIPHQGAKERDDMELFLCGAMSFVIIRLHRISSEADSGSGFMFLRTL